MAKSKRKIASTQRDKFTIEAAKYLKKAGILSKQAKLHSGRYVSRGVLKKVRENASAYVLGYKAYKVPKSVAKLAKEQNYVTVQGSRIIGPKEPTFRKRIAEAIRTKGITLTGVRPVKGGMMEEVLLPHTIMDMYSLVEQLKSGIDDLKNPGEQFAFKFFGFESYRAFRDSRDLLEYLTHYKSIFAPGGTLRAKDLTEEFQNLTIFRLHPADIGHLIRGPSRRPKPKRTNRAGRSGEDVNPDRTERLRGRSAKRARERRENMTKKQLNAYRKKARERAHKSYHGRKGK